MEKEILKPKFFRTMLSSASIFAMVMSIFVLYLWLVEDESPLKSIDTLFVIPLVAHLIGTSIGFKSHVETLSIALSKEGIEGPQSRFFGKAKRVFMKFGDIEKVTNVGRPRWLFPSKIISKGGAKITVDWGIDNDDYKLILIILENHYVKVSDYVWQIYPDR